MPDFDFKKVAIIGGIVVLVFGIIIAVFIFIKKPPAHAPVTLNFWGTFDDESAYRDAIDAYKKLAPYATVKYKKIDFVPGQAGQDGYEDTLINAFSDGTGPDIWLMHNTWLPKRFNLIAPMPTPAKGDPLMTIGDFQKAFPEVAEQDLTANSKIYALPIYIDTLALFYRKDMLDAAGIPEPPTTWNDFVEDVKKITKYDTANNIAQSAAAIGTAQNINRSTDILAMLMLQSGVEMTDDTFSEASFTKTTAKSDGKEFNAGETAVQFYTQFANPRLIYSKLYTWNDQQDYSSDAFIRGKTAMVFAYAHFLATLSEQAAHLRYATSPMPQLLGSSKPVTYANYWAPTVWKGSKNVDEAWKFINYLASKEGDTLYVRSSKRPTARRDLIAETESISDLKPFAKQVLTARSWYQIDNVQIEDIFSKMIDSINRANVPIRDALLSAEKQITALMTRRALP